MARDLPVSMRRPKTLRMKKGGGSGWFYVSRRGIDVYVAETPCTGGKHQFTITKREMEKALEAIRKDKEQA